MLMILPPPAASMCGTTARAVCSTVRALRSSRKFQSLSEVSWTGAPMRKPPAMLQRTSMRLNCRSASFTAASTWAWSSRLVGRSTGTTLAPSPANAFDRATPRFPAAPVIITVFPLNSISGCPLLFRRAFQDAAAHLVELDRFEQRLEVAFAEALVAFALDELEEDRPELVLAEDLQQQLAGLAVDQDLALFQLGDVLAVPGNALVHQLVVGIDGIEQLHAARAQRVDGLEEIPRAHRDVLDALAAVSVEVFADLPGLLVAFLVDRDADLAAGAGERLALHARHLSFDVEVADLPEAEQALVEIRPFLHPAAVHVVREVVDVEQAVPRGRERRAGKRLEIHVEEADVADLAFLRPVLAAPAVDEVDERIADALDRGDVELAGPGMARVTPGAERDGALVGCLCVAHAESDGAHAGPVQAREALRE